MTQFKIDNYMEEVHTVAISGHIRPDGVATPKGRAAASAARQDEARWQVYRRLSPEAAAGSDMQGIAPLAETLPPDVIADLDRRLAEMGRAEVMP